MNQGFFLFLKFVFLNPYPVPLTMKKLFLLILTINFCLSSFSQTFPIAKKKDFIDVHHNEPIHDYYQWMENLEDAELNLWLNEQADYTKQHLKPCHKVGTYSKIRAFSMASYEDYYYDGGYYFVLASYSDVTTPALFYTAKKNRELSLLVDPMSISTKDNIRIKSWAVDKSGKYLAYLYSRNGLDWCEINIINLQSENTLKDHLVDIKLSSIHWKDDGFYYAKYPNTGFSGATVGREIYFHKLGTPQSEDKLIMNRKNSSGVDVFTTDDERFVMLHEVSATTGTSNYFYRDLMSSDTTFLPFITRLKPEDETSIVANDSSTFFLFTKSKAPNGMVVKTTLASPRKWEVVVPEIEGAQLIAVWNANHLLVTLHQSFAQQTLSFFDQQGNLMYSIPIAIGSSLRQFSGDPEKSEAIFSFTSYVAPAIVYTIDLTTFYTEPFGRTLLNFDASEYMMRLAECTASDGTIIPITMVYHKDTKLDKPTMCLLEAYGGFGVMHSASFDPGIITFLKEGGVWAYAHIRGGGEGGKEWADAGRGLNKERSFEDFINAAEFLVKEGITTSNNLAITGGSNGGLVVAAAMIRRPELFKVAVPVVGAFDMLRFHLFTVGVFHADEYGDITTPEGYELLKRYSPYHNLKKGTSYPATLIMTSEFDDRVPPFHSYKFAAALQEANGGTNPILLRVQEKAGHQGGQTFFDRTQEESDKLDFIIHHCKTK